MKYYIIEDMHGKQYVEYAENDQKALEEAEEKYPTTTFTRITFHGDNPPLWYKTSLIHNTVLAQHWVETGTYPSQEN